MTIENPKSKTQSPTSRLGVLGGTFDPPHNGHLVIAQAALTQLKLDRVLFMPTSQPPHKLGNHITPIAHRLEMVRLAIAPYPQFALSRIDVDRTGPTYTVDTLQLLRAQFGNEIEFYFIMGMDSLANILTWRAPDRLIRLCRLAVFKRPGFSAKLDDLEKQLPGLRARVVFVDAPTRDIAASELQRRVRDGQSIANGVPVSVANYIEKQGLYRNQKETGC